MASALIPSSVKSLAEKPWSKGQGVIPVPLDKVDVFKFASFVVASKVSSSPSNSSGSNATIVTGSAKTFGISTKKPPKTAAAVKKIVKNKLNPITAFVLFKTIVFMKF